MPVRECRSQGRDRQAYRDVFTASRGRACWLSSELFSSKQEQPGKESYS